MDSPYEQKKTYKRPTKNANANNGDEHMDWSRQKDLQGKTAPNQGGKESHLLRELLVDNGFVMLTYFDPPINI